MHRRTSTRLPATASPFNITRHCIASATILVLMSAMGAVALLHGHNVSERITLRGQENFSSFRTASSEASR